MSTKRTVLIIVVLVVVVVASLFVNYLIKFRDAYEIAIRMKKATTDSLQSSDTLRLVNIATRKQEVVKIDSSKIYLINQFATWCGPCIKELPYVRRLYNLHGQSSVFMIISEEDVDRLSNFFSLRNNSVPVYQTVGKLPKFLYSMTIPYTVVIKKGKVVYTIAEEIKEADYNVIDSLLR
jgi:thiol-disulfide isomerase/thioredoxin